MRPPKPGLWLCNLCEFEEDRDFYAGGLAMDGICARCGTLATNNNIFEAECQDPRWAHHHYGPREFTTSVALMRADLIVWDVNCYYRDLGVPTNASRAMIRAAYQAREGWRSERMTYVVKQLLNVEVRSTYDRCQPGSVFFDRYWREYVLRKMHEEMTQALGHGIDIEDMEKIDLPAENEPLQVVDRPSSEDDTSLRRWPWGFMLWQSGCRDTDRLARWQGHLARAFAERGITRKLSIGFLGKHMEPAWEVIEVGHHVVVLLNETKQPSHDLAIQVVDRVEAPASSRTKELIA